MFRNHCNQVVIFLKLFCGLFCFLIDMVLQQIHLVFLSASLSIILRKLYIFVCQIFDHFIQIRDGGHVKNVSFSNIIIETRRFADCWWGCAEPITITTHNRDDNTRSGHISGIRFRNITCDSENGVLLSGRDGNHIEDVLFDNVQITIRAKSKWERGLYDLRPGIRQEIEHIPTAGFYMRRADDITLRDCRVHFAGDKLDEFGEAVRCEDCENVVLRDFDGKAARPGLQDVVL